MSCLTLELNNACSLLMTVETLPCTLAPFFYNPSLFSLMSENKLGSLRSFRKDYPKILANESKHWKALKNLSSSVSLFFFFYFDPPPPPPNKINR